MKPLLATLGCLILLSACSSMVPVPEAPDVPQKTAEEGWARVLKQNVDSEGRINFVAVGKKIGDLKAFVRYISKVDEKSFANQNDRLAFYLNAYNALSMYNVIISDYPEDLDGFFKRFSFFYKKRFTVMRQEMSLYTFENEYVRKMGDPRVHVALNCMSKGCPRLPQEPFVGSTLEAQLEREATKFYNEPRNVRTDAAHKKVFISEILSFFTKDFLAKSPTLIDYVNRYRKEKVPADYEVEFIDYDWTIYRQPGT